MKSLVILVNFLYIALGLQEPELMSDLMSEWNLTGLQPQKTNHCENSEPDTF